MLNTVTSNPFTGILLGAGITVAVQSSSATTVMLVGLVNSGIMEFAQTIPVIFGANIGTTVTAWITSLSALKNDNFFLALLKPANLAGIMAFVGILLFAVTGKPKKKDIGSIFLGFAVLMFGMEQMSGAVEPLSEMPRFRDMLTMFDNPFAGVLVGTVFTGIIQSSAASIGILQALSLSGNLTFSMAIPIILGLNIGTCVTALISCIGANKPAKRVAVVNITINIIGAVLSMAVLYGVGAIVPLPFMQKTANPFTIAVFHSVFNIVNTAVLLPFTKLLEKFSRLMVPDRREPGEQNGFIDERLLGIPSLAISECFQKTCEMADMAIQNMRLAMDICENYNAESAEHIDATEVQIDKYEDFLGTSLVKISALELSRKEGEKVSLMLHTIGDFERIGDHAVNLLRTANEINEKNIKFSESAGNEIAVLHRALDDILSRSRDSFVNGDIPLAKTVEPLEQVIDRLTSKMKSRHIERLRHGLCTIETGFVLSDMLNNIERVSDHCSNIAVATIELDNDSFLTHEYLEDMKTENPEFKEQYGAFKERYSLPAGTDWGAEP